MNNKYSLVGNLISDRNLNSEEHFPLPAVPFISRAEGRKRKHDGVGKGKQSKKARQGGRV